MTLTTARPRSAVLDFLQDARAQVVAGLQDLVRIASISGSAGEREIQQVLAEQFARDGLEVDYWPLPLDELTARPDFPGVEVERDSAYGLVARRGGTGGGASLMLNCHVDVVPPGDPARWRDAPFSGAADAERVYGRGTCDMKGGLAAAVWAVRALDAVGVSTAGDVLLACVVGEEDGGLGTYATLERGWRADACVIPEPTSLDLAPANGGSLTFRLTVPGLATHASRRYRGVSAVDAFVVVRRALAELERRRNQDPHPLMRRWTIPYCLEIGTVRAGDWASSVPDLLVADGRYGVRLGETVQDARAELEATVAEACAADPWLCEHPVQVQWWGGQFAPGHTDPDAPIVATVGRTSAALTGRRPEVWGAPYGSDLRLMQDIGGVPTVQYGPGDAALAHGPGESVPIDEVLTAAAVLALTALEWCGGEPPRSA